jgi:hypothetical protein
MTKEYTHELHKEILSISGRYELEKEGRMVHDGRELLYVIANTVVDSSCCGYGCWQYAVVPGFIVSWRSRQNQEGHCVSDVEPISDETSRQEIRKLLHEMESVSQVQFW